jgi:epoxyqueuosine reductase
MESLQNPWAQSLAFRFETSAALGADCTPVERSATASLRNLSKPAADSLLRACPAAAFRLTLELVRALAQEAGFSEAGVVALPYPAEERDAARFEEWLGAGRAGMMHYLSRKADDGQLLRSRVAIPFPWARSAIVCLASYHAAQPRSTDAAEEGAGWIARYAWSGRRDAAGAIRPSDYHKVLRKRVRALEARLHKQFGSFEARGFVDTGPVVERALAQAAGLGWTGKNTCLIHPKLGSYGFLAVLVTSLEIEKEKVPTMLGAPGPASGTWETSNLNQPRSSEAAAPTVLVPDRCGSCRRCLDACPTGALTAPYQMDARRCIAYLTIEHRGPVDENLRKGMGRQIFGCDICQDVCPWNRRAPIEADPELVPRTELVNPALDALAQFEEAGFERLFNGSPVRRAGFEGLRRNLAIAMGNSGLGRFLPRLEEWTASEDDGLRAAAQWALKRLRKA